MKYSNILEFLIFIYSDIAIFYMFYSIPLCADFYTNFIKGFPGYRDIIGKKKKKKKNYLPSSNKNSCRGV